MTENEIKQFISRNNWQFYISRETDVLTERAMSQGWFEYISQKIPVPSFRRVSIFTSGLADIYVCPDDIAMYKKWLRDDYARNKLKDIKNECWLICRQVSRKTTQNDFYKQIKALAPALILPRIVEMTLTDMPDWRNDVSAKSVIDDFSQINEFRRRLVNEKSLSIKRVAENCLLYVNNNDIGVARGDLAEYQNLLAKYQPVKTSNKLYGQTVYAGRVVAPARLVKNRSDYNDVKPGEIVITNMTQPEIYPAVGKIKGIITDEGGMLCHAAVLARESKIPCLTGTKVATKTFKDGDIVILNANQSTCFVK